MMRPVGDVKVYLHRAPIDMRTGRNGLAALVREGMQQDPFAAQALYVFIGRRKEQTTFRIPIVHRRHRVSLASFVWKEGGSVPTYRSSRLPSCSP